MLTSVCLPAFAAQAAAASVTAVHAAVGDFIASGGALVDLRVDFSGGTTYDCPPIAYYRVVLREDGWVRRLGVVPGAPLAAGALIALLGTDAQDASEGQPAREARVMLASILPPDDLWETT